MERRAEHEVQVGVVHRASGSVEGEERPFNAKADIGQVGAEVAAGITGDFFVLVAALAGLQAHVEEPAYTDKVLDERAQREPEGESLAEVILARDHVVAACVEVVIAVLVVGLGCEVEAQVGPEEQGKFGFAGRRKGILLLYRGRFRLLFLRWHDDILDILGLRGRFGGIDGLLGLGFVLVGGFFLGEADAGVCKREGEKG